MRTIISCMEIIQFLMKILKLIDSYVMQIRQVATLLGYGEPQVLEVFKNMLPTKLYWILFPIDDLRQAVETAKIILTKEKLDKQLTGQTSTSPFMHVRDGTEKKVSFNARDELGDKIDKLKVVMNRLAAKDSYERRPFKPKYITVEVRTGPIVRKVMRIEAVDQIVETEDSMETTDLDKTIEIIILEGTLEDMEDKIIEESIEVMDATSITETEIDQEKGHSQGIGIEVPVIVDQDQDLKLILTEIE